jgi:hypothetical protein
MDLYYVYLEWWAILLILVGLPFVVVPFLVRSTLRLSADPVMGLVDQRALPVDVARYFWSQTPGLEAAGFGVAACFTISEQTTHSYATCVMWTNRRGGEVAVASVRKVGGGPTMLPQRTFHSVEFITAFSTGVTVVTGNRPELPVTTIVPKRHEIQVPEVTSPPVLHRLHTFRVERFDPGNAARSVPTPGYELIWYRNLIALALREQHAAGWLLRDGETRYRPSWRAAILIAWGLMPPARWVRAWRRREDGERALAEARHDPNRHSIVR